MWNSYLPASVQILVFIDAQYLFFDSFLCVWFGTLHLFLFLCIFFCFVYPDYCILSLCKGGAHSKKLDGFQMRLFTRKNDWYIYQRNTKLVKNYYALYLVSRAFIFWEKWKFVFIFSDRTECFVSLIFVTLHCKFIRWRWHYLLTASFLCNHSSWRFFTTVSSECNWTYRGKER